MLLAALAWPGAARADEGEAMVAHLRRYFHGELDEAAAWLGVGAGAGYLAGSLFANGRDAAVAASVPLVAVGAIQIGAGVVLLARTDRQIRDLSALARRDLAAYRRQELPRMIRVNRWFIVYEGVEIALAATGAGLAIYGGVMEARGAATRGSERALGAGIGLGAQGLAMLTFDLTAAARANEYTRWIRTLTVAPAGEAAGLALAGSF